MQVLTALHVSSPHKMRIGLSRPRGVQRTILDSLEQVIGVCFHFKSRDGDFMNISILGPIARLCRRLFR